MNYRIFKVLSVLAILLTAVLSLISCEDDGGASLIISSDTYVVDAGETIDIEDIRKPFPADTEPLTVTTPDDTSADRTDAVADEEADDTVYWVKNGEVWHTRSTCASLSRSKNILSGTVEEAMLAGKGRVCKRCGN